MKDQDLNGCLRVAFSFPMPRLTTLKPRVAALRNAAPRVVTTKRISGRRLQAIRAAQFSENPLCERCAERGLVTLGTQSDHFVALINGGADTMANRQLLCDDCHREKTREDMAIARNGGAG